MAFDSMVAENVGTLTVFVVTFLAVVLFLKSWAKSGINLPKGPATIPFFGNILSLKENDELLNQTLAWSKEHGPVYTLDVGRKSVYVNGLEAFKEITCKTGLDFADRAEVALFLTINSKRLGIFDTKADAQWRNQRRFAHSTLRGMGFGKVSLEPLITKEAQELIDYFKNSKESLLDPSIAFGVTSSNVINKLVFNHRVEHGSESGNDLVNNVRELMTANEGAMLTLFPFLWPVLKYTKRWRTLFQAWETIQKFFHQEIEIRTKRIEASKGEPEINDFLDAYLINRRTDPESYTLEALDFTLLDLYLAGTDTTATTLSWAVAYLVTHPQIQQKLHDEIMNEIGEKEVSLSHRSGLPYTQAALFEIQRLATVAPFVLRAASTDASLMGHKIPKGTNLFLSIWSLHYDPDVWKNPKQFNPDRFLQEDGTLVKQPENLLPFSAGKRMCMGDGLAKMELFLFFTMLVQQLKFSLPPGHDSIPLDGLLDLVRKPKPFKVQVSTWSD